MPLLIFLLTFISAGTLGVYSYMNHTQSMEDMRKKIHNAKKIAYVSQRYALEQYSANITDSVMSTDVLMSQKVTYNKTFANIEDMSRFEKAIDDIVINHGIDNPGCTDFGLTTHMSIDGCLGMAILNVTEYNLQYGGLVHQDANISNAFELSMNIAPSSSHAINNKIQLSKQSIERELRVLKRIGNMSQARGLVKLSEFIQNNNDKYSGYIEDELNDALLTTWEKIDPTHTTTDPNITKIPTLIGIRHVDKDISLALSALSNAHININENSVRGWYLMSKDDKKALWDSIKTKLEACRTSLSPGYIPCKNAVIGASGGIISSAVNGASAGAIVDFNR